MIIRPVEKDLLNELKNLASNATIQKISARLTFMVRLVNDQPYRGYNISKRIIDFYTIENEITAGLQSYYDYLPVPAITSVDIDPAPDGIYGLMARATVNVRVFSLKQLKEIEWAFFPGITAIIEVVRSRNNSNIDFLTPRYIQNPNLLKDIVFSPEKMIEIHKASKGNRIFFVGILKRTTVSSNNNTFDVSFEFSNFSIASVFFARNLDASNVEAANKTLSGFFSDVVKQLKEKGRIFTATQVGLSQTFEQFRKLSGALPAADMVQGGYFYDVQDTDDNFSIASNFFDSREYITFGDFVEEVLLRYIEITYPKDFLNKQFVFPFDIQNSYMFIHNNLRTNTANIVFPTEYFNIPLASNPDAIMGQGDIIEHNEWFFKNFNKVYNFPKNGTVGKISKILLDKSYLMSLLLNFENIEEKPFAEIIDTIVRDIIKATYNFSQLFIMKVGKENPRFVIYDNRLLDIDVTVDRVDIETRVKPSPPEINIFELQDARYSFDIPEFLSMAVMMRRLSNSLKSYTANPINFLVPDSVEDVVLSSLRRLNVEGNFQEEGEVPKRRVVTKININADALLAIMSNENFSALKSALDDTPIEQENTWGWIEKEYSYLFDELSKEKSLTTYNETNVIGIASPELERVGNEIKLKRTENNKKYVSSIYLILALQNAGLSQEDWDLFLNAGAGFKNEEKVRSELSKHYKNVNDSTNVNALIAKKQRELGNTSNFLSIKNNVLSDKKEIFEDVEILVINIDETKVVYIPKIREIFYKTLMFFMNYEEENRGNAANYLTGVTLNITVPGNSLWRIFDTFRLRGIPDTYFDNGYFIVTKIRHSVSGGSWTTDVEAKYFYTGG